MYCVVVGDIVNSQQLAPDVRDKVTQAAIRVFDRININPEYAGSLMANFGIVRGDAFEGILLTQSHAPKIVQTIIKEIYKVEKTAVRISVVLGQLTVRGDDRNITDGPAFHEAMDLLNEMKEAKKTHWLQVSFVVGSLAQSLVDSQLELLTVLTQGWTEKQREAVWVTQSYNGQQNLAAKSLGIAPSSVNKHLNAANYKAYCRAWKGLEDYLVNMDEYTVEGKPAIEKSYVPYFNMALREYCYDRHEEALPLMQKSLTLAKEELGESDSSLIPIYNYLAEIHSCNKEYEKAESAIEESFKLQRNMPKARLQYIETSLLKASVCRCKRDFEEAQKRMEETLKIANDTLEPNHNFLSSIYNELALNYENLDKYKEALKNHKSALAIAEANMGEVGIVNYAVALYNVANSYFAFGEHEQAHTYAEEALQIFEDNLPLNHEYTKNTKALLSKIKEIQGGETA